MNGEGPLRQPAGVEGRKTLAKVCPPSARGNFVNGVGGWCVGEKVRSKLIASVFALNEVKYVCGNDGLRVKSRHFLRRLSLSVGLM